MRIILLVFCCILLRTNASAQKLFRSPDEYVSTDQPIVKVIGGVEDKIACFIDDEDGYKIIWYDSAMRKWGTSALDFLDRTTTDMQVQLGANSVFVYHQKRDKKMRRLYVSEVIPLHKDTIKPRAIDSINLVTFRDDTRFSLHNTNQLGVMAYSLSSYNLQERKFNFNIKTIQDATTINELANGYFNAAVYNNIWKVHLIGNNKAYIFFGEPANAAGSYQKITAGYKSSYSDMQFTVLDLNDNIMNPKLYYDANSNQMIVGAQLLSQRPSSSNTLWKSSFSYTNNAWSDPSVAKRSSQDGSLNLYRTKLRNFIPKQDGGAIYFLEKSFEEIQTRSRSMAMMPSGMLFGGGSYNYSVFHNDQIYAVSVNGKGLIEWQKEISKSQESNYPVELTHSYSILEYPIGNVLLYTHAVSGENKFVTTYVSKNGDLQQRQFSSSVYDRMEDDDILIQLAQQISVNEIVFPVLQRRTISFVKIDF